MPKVIYCIMTVLLFFHTHADVKAIYALSVLKVLLANRAKDNILHIFKVGDAFAHCRKLL